MSAQTNTERDDYSSESGTTFHLESESGERLVVNIGPTGLTTIQVATIDESTTLDSIVVHGLTPQQATQKSRGFWGRLWDKIKGAAEAVVDAFTFDAGPLKCRPSVSVGTQNGRVVSGTIGISCQDNLPT